MNPNVSPALALAARTLQIDVCTVRVVTALADAGIESVVLKGPVLARTLYDDGALRPYSDSDVLVAASDFEPAQRILEGMGFERFHPFEERDPHQATGVHAHVWWRPADGCSVDLHRTLQFIDVPPEVAGRELMRDLDEIPLAGTRVKVLGRPALALHVALHAARNGPRNPKSLEDLARALDRFDDDVWAPAAELAGRLGAVPGLTAGLRLLPAGVPVAERLGLPPVTSRMVALFAASPPPVTLGLQRLTMSRGAWGKVKFLASELVPSPTFMRVWSPLARRGRWGLIAAYLTRPWILARQLGPALRAWRETRQALRREDAPR